MIYGLNFGGPDVTKAPVHFTPTKRNIGRTFRLVGIATSIEERDAMLVTADNGRRLLLTPPQRRGHWPIYAA
jgi:hypothetical protein